MAIRNIRTLGDPALRKVCREVTHVNERTKILIEDMIDTMREADGVGLAAPQVGVLKRIVVIDVGDGPYVLINPEITEREGIQSGYEGCLSVPGKTGIVERPARVKVRALDEEMQPFELEGEEMLARAICHECDHLEGIVYVDKVKGELYDAQDIIDDEGTDHNEQN